MREIKFRLIRDGQIVGYEKHTKSGNSGIEIYHSKVNDDCEDWEWAKNVLVIRSAWIKHDTKEQFTGLLDSEGREIYEGDISKHGYVIRYNHEKALFAEHNGRGAVMSYPMDGSQITIIGNIHQNPELLEAPNA